jgi:hypothetical protein
VAWVFSWFAAGLLGISHFDSVWMSSFLFFTMFVKWMMWQIMSGCCKMGSLQCNLTVGALLGERKGEKRVWDVGRWWVGVSDVVVMVGWKGGKMKKRWLEVSLILV